MIEKITTSSFFENCYIISNEKNECVLVDPGLQFEKAYKLISSKYQVKAILLTHGHLDHIDGIRYFDCPIYIHKDEESFIYDDYLSLYRQMGMKNTLKELPLNLCKVSSGDIINLIGFSFKVIHTPGHTSGSVCYLCNKDLFSGDTLFNYSCGRVDFPTGNTSQMQKSLNYLMDTLSDDVKVYAGHNDLTTIGIERAHNPYVNGRYSLE